MEHPLKDKVVFLTGASSGIGWAAARAFARRGAWLAIAARRADKLKELAGLISGSSEGGKARTLCLPCDVSSEPQVRQAVELAVREWGRIDILINNAGISRTQSFPRQEITEIEEVIRTNLLGTLYATHAVLPHMGKQGSGHIVNVASIAGLLGLPYMAAYSASKFGVVGFTQSLRSELRGTGITLTALCPGTVDTPMASEPLKDPVVWKKVRPKSPEQVAELIVRICLHKPPQVVYGEVPAAGVHLARLMPRLADWAMHALYERYHPTVRRIRAHD